MVIVAIVKSWEIIAFYIQSIDFLFAFAVFTFDQDNRIVNGTFESIAERKVSGVEIKKRTWPDCDSDAEKKHCE